MDDGNTLDGDACASDCSEITTYCGDGVIEPPEARDDGNQDNGDGCRSDCGESEFADDCDLDWYRDGFDEVNRAECLFDGVIVARRYAFPVNIFVVMSHMIASIYPPAKILEVVSDVARKDSLFAIPYMLVAGVRSALVLLPSCTFDWTLDDSVFIRCDNGAVPRKAMNASMEDAAVRLHQYPSCTYLW